MRNIVSDEDKAWFAAWIQHVIVDNLKPHVDTVLSTNLN